MITKKTHEVAAEKAAPLSKRVTEIDTGLHRSRLRQKLYEAKGDARSAQIEADVQDRLLRERFQLAPS